MPLKTGSSQETISHNIAEMVDEFKDEGHIGTSHPASQKAAVKQAAAIAYTKAGRSRKQAPAKKAHA